VQIARQQLRVSDQAEDDLLALKIEAATQVVEKLCGRSLITQAWTLYLDGGPGGDVIDLPRPPLTAITSIHTYDQADTETEFGAANYRADLTGSRAELVDGSSWPTGLRSRRAFRVIYATGYGDQAQNVPGALREAVLQLVAHWFEHRGDEPLVPPRVVELIGPYQWRML
jgi:uncharacterized phiE125 gp8 family phage protein